MSRPRGKGRGRRNWEPRIRVNDRIRVREVRVVDAEGEQVGIMKAEEALALAKRHLLDLVEISPNARPPVCRICDFGKYQYEESKKKKETNRNSHAGKLKEVQLRPRCEQHDFDFKLAHATNFLCQDMKVKIHLRFRGRENAHKDIGFDTVKRFIDSLKPWGKADIAPRLAGRGIDALVNPLPKNQRAENPHAKEKLQELEEETDQENDTTGGSGEINTPFENLDKAGKE
ncbi:MAG: translation initiation factor IF-3 [Verrucomicrobiota bacterium]|nr:translation initiation factor IF-3 [Verrucomicrobiota bacterium]